MAISRKCKMSRWNKIQNALKNAKNIDDAYIIFEQFSSQMRKIAQLLTMAERK
ncbi:MAG: hypothetical protein SA398_09525 [Methanosarcina sp.]|nr:hypothetical protein [Methanosarcina sp.]MDW5554786.1 hypothetical protein [Methanosarcina sp.]MDW5559915.1 hypothetical protein [Methanosarcina sp.]